MENNKRKLQEKESRAPIISLPGVRNELVRDPGYFVIREGLDFGFIEDLWNGIKKIAHKLGVR